MLETDPLREFSARHGAVVTTRSPWYAHGVDGVHTAPLIRQIALIAQRSGNLVRAQRHTRAVFVMHDGIGGDTTYIPACSEGTYAVVVVFVPEAAKRGVELADRASG